MGWDGMEGDGRGWKGMEGKKRYDLRMQLQFVLYAAQHDNCFLRLIGRALHCIYRRTHR